MEDNEIFSNSADYKESQKKAAEYSEADGFTAVDVSEPRKIRRESEIMAEERREYIKQWLIRHRVHIFFVVALLAVAAIVTGVIMYQDNSNPVARLIKASAKNFETPCSFEMTLSKDGEDVMKYNGVADIDRSSQQIRILYDAKYQNYGYTSATLADGKMFVGGSLYDGKWRVSDCEEKVRDFFDFDTDIVKGKIDAGALLRFFDLNTMYSSTEMQKFLDSLSSRLAVSSELAEVNYESIEGGARYTFDINVDSFFAMLDREGAPVFNRAEDYNDFKARYQNNSDVIKAAKCKLSYTISDSGNLSSLSAEMKVNGESYSMKLGFSGFGAARPELPEEFLAQAEKLSAK